MYKQYIYLIALLCVFNTSGQSLNDGLVGYYPFNGNANDESGNVKHATNVGATLTTDRFGNQNSAYSFNGSSNYISTPINSNNTGKITLCAWIKTTGPSSTETGYNLYGIICSRSGTLNTTDLATFNFPLNNSHPGNWIVADIDQGNNSISQIFASASNIMDDSWHFVATTLDGTSQNIYIDGMLKAQIARNVTLNVKANFIIGNDNLSDFLSGYYRYFKGGIDDVRIYDRALSASEIQALKNETPSNCTQKIEVTDTLRISFIVTSYNPLHYSNIIKVYPNPSSSGITLDFGDYSQMAGHKINISNSIGTLVYSKEISQAKEELNLSSWTGPGIYVLQLIDNQNYTVETKKIVLE